MVQLVRVLRDETVGDMPDLDGMTLLEAAAALTAAAATFPAGAFIDFRMPEGGSAYYAVCVRRPETDQELAQRQAKRDAEDQRAREINERFRAKQKARQESRRS